MCITSKWIEDEKRILNPEQGPVDQSLFSEMPLMGETPGQTVKVAKNERISSQGIIARSKKNPYPYSKLINNIDLDWFLNVGMKSAISYENAHVNTMRILPLSKELFLTGGYCGLKLWSVNQTQCLSVFDDYPNSCFGIVSLTNSQFCSIYWNLGTVRVWCLREMKLLKEIQTGEKELRAVEALSDRKIAIAFNDITIIDTETEKRLRVLVGHSSDVYRLRKVDHNRLASCSWDNTLKVWNFLTGELLMTFSEGKGKYYALSVIAPNMLFAGRDKTGFVIDLQKADKVRYWNAGKEIISSCSLGEEVVALGFKEGSVEFWNWKLGCRIEQLDKWQSDNNWIWDIAVVGNKMVSLSGDGSIKLVDLKS